MPRRSSRGAITAWWRPASCEPPTQRAVKLAVLKARPTSSATAWGATLHQHARLRQGRRHHRQLRKQRLMLCETQLRLGRTQPRRVPPDRPPACFTPPPAAGDLIAVQYVQPSRDVNRANWRAAPAPAASKMRSKQATTLGTRPAVSARRPRRDGGRAPQCKLGSGRLAAAQGSG